MSDKRTERQIIDEAYSNQAAMTWKAPVQGYPGGIPWSLHLEVYEAYSKIHSSQIALIDLKGHRCRGGFDVEELDRFVPGWRARAVYINRVQVAFREAFIVIESLIDDGAISADWDRQKAETWLANNRDLLK